MARKSFPTRVFLGWEEPLNDAPFMVVETEKAGDLVDGDGPTTIGIYTLEQTVVLTKSLTIAPKRAKRAAKRPKKAPR
jgi:hypothetical protein